MASLAEQISNLANPTPVFEDPEDITDGTAAAVIQLDLSADDDFLSPPEGATTLRSRAAALLDEDDAKYAGKRVSRRQQQDTGSGEDEFDEESDEELGASESEGSGEEEEESDEEEDEELDGFKEQMKFHSSKEFSFEDDGDYSKYADDSDDSGDDDEEDDDDQEASNLEDEISSSTKKKDKEDKQKDAGRSMQQFSQVDVDAEMEKGRAVRSQLGIWDSMVEARIKLQKVLVIANQLPGPDSFDTFSQAGGSEYTQALEEGQSFLQTLLEQLVSLQTALLWQNPETRHLADYSEDKSSASNTHKEETPSDDEADSGQSEARRRLLKRKLPADEYPEFLAKRHADFTSYRNTTIQKWYDKTRMASGKVRKGFGAFDLSTVKQINQILSDKDRLIKRTQLRRSSYRTLGKPVEKPTEVKPEPEGSDDQPEQMLGPSSDQTKNYDPEIFDDDDFYHQILRELIERKTSEVTDPSALGKHWSDLQKLRSKSKKVVDRKASKGRKIRFNILPKLVNFMAPVEKSLWTHEARNELFKSLFGNQSGAT